MKRLISIVFVIVIAGLMSGCCLSHEWAAATCDEPKRCVKCGETEGTPLGHTWEDATCTTPKTCSVCKATSGEALGHTWVDRTLEAPKTCSVCGATEGEPIVFKELNFTKIDAESIFALIFCPDTIIADDMDNKRIFIYDYDENLVKEIDFSPYMGEDWVFDIDIIPPYLNNSYYITFTVVDPEKNCTLLIYDEKGEEIAKFREKVDIPDGHRISYRNVTEKRYARFCDETAATAEPLMVVDFETMTLVSADTGEDPVAVYGNRYESISGMAFSDEYLLATKKDGRRMYLSARYHTIAGEFRYATQLNVNGIAMVAEDDGVYKLIDSKLNVIAENVLKGSVAYWRGDAVFLVYVDGKKHYYTVK